jgi:hypothetical protein
VFNVLAFRTRTAGEEELGIAMTKLSAGALVVLLIALATAVTASGGDRGREKIRFNAADQAAARAAVIRRADLGSASGWKGGATKPDLTPAPTCPNYHPKQSDLVLTGAAETHWTHAGADFDSEAQVLQTARMVQLDWQRSIQVPGFVPCFRRQLVKALGSKATLVSFKRIAFPHIARYAGAFRLLADVRSQGQTVRVMIELIVVGRGRTEITLTASAPAAARSSVSAAALRLARILVARARA